MKPTLQMALMVLATLPGCAGQPTFERNYEPRAVLTAEQEQIVIELARRRGFEHVEKIETGRVIHTDDFVITVRERAAIEGRLVRQRFVWVNYVKWIEGFTPEPGEFTIGDFSAEMPIETEETILFSHGREFRLPVENVSVADCERIIGFFLDRKFKLGRFIVPENVQGIDFANPESIAKYELNGDVISVSLRPSKADSLYTHTLDIKLREDHVEILGVGGYSP